MATVDDAADAFTFGDAHLFDLVIEVLHEVLAGWRRWRSRWRRGGSARTSGGALRPGPRRRSAGQRVLATRVNRIAGPARHEVVGERHVLVEERRAAGELIGSVVLEDGPDDRSLRKRQRRR